MVTIADFRSAFPEFQAVDLYTDEAIQFWFDQAGVILPARRLNRALPLATMLFVAHNITFSAMSARAASKQGIPGATGVLTGKSVDKVSFTYDAGVAARANDGHWNATSYGQRLRSLLRGLSVGPFYVEG